MSSKARILVAHDDPGVRKTLSEILEAEGYASTAVPDGKAALDWVGEAPPVVALIDLKLRDMSGLELMAEIKTRSPDTECIVVTEYASQAPANEAAGPGAESRLQKPCEADQLLVMVRRAIERAQRLEQMRRRADEAAALLATAQAISSLDLDAVLRTVASQAKALFKADGSRIHLIEPDGKTLRCAVALHKRAEAVMAIRLRIGQGLTGRVALTGVPELIPDTLEDPQFIQVPGTPVESEAMALIPLKARERVIGVMTVSRLGADRPFHQADLPLLTAFANQAAVAIENARLFEETRRRAAHQEALNAVIAAAAAAPGLPDLLESALDHTLQALGMEVGAIWLAEVLGSPSDLHVLRGFPPEAGAEPGPIIARVTQATGEDIAEPQAVEDWQAVEGPLPTLTGAMTRLGIRASLTAPILAEGRRIGGLSVVSRDPRGWSPEEIALVEAVGRQIGGAAERARLYVAERSRREMLDALYHLSRQLVATDQMEEVLNSIARHAVESVHVTFCRILILESGSFVCRAAHPVRVLERDLGVGRLEPSPACSHYGRVLKQEKPLVLSRDDAVLSAAERDALFLDVAQTLCLCPLRVSLEQIGVMVLGEARSPAREPFSRDKLRLVSAIADQAASAIHRAMLHHQTEQRLERLDALRTIDMAITSSLNLDVTLNVLLDQLTKRLNVDAADIMLLNPHTLTLEYAAGRGIPSGGIRQIQPRLGECLAGRAVLERRLIHIPDLREFREQFPRASLLAAEGFVACYAAPLIAKGRVKGLLEVFHRSPLNHDAEWPNFLEAVAAQAAIAIDNIELFENLQRSNVELTLAYDNTLEGWARALELRDAETEGHSRRVTEMTLRLARAMGVSDEELVHIRRGVLLHDIGKMGVPDSILLKPGPLSEEEWEIMHQHPVHAYAMLSPIPYLRRALDIPYCHHEKWDGTGYPRGLEGEQIPLAARIFAVVDVYDALCSGRPYRPAWPEEKVRQYIREQAGKHFDPQVVKVFLKLLESGLNGETR